MAKEFERVVGIDINVRFLEKIKIKTRYFKNIEIKEMNILNTSFDDKSFDLILFEGVLEWVGRSNRKKSPKECQIQAIKECKRLLRDNGLLYVGIENKLFPYFWLNDPHTHTPLTVILPRSLSKTLYSLLKNNYYGIQLYNYWGYIKIFKIIFGNCKIMLPIPHYKYLYELSLFKGKELRKKVRKVSKIKNFRKSYKLILITLKVISLIGLLKLFAPNFIILCRKTKN